MGDDKSNRGEPDRSKINVNEPHEVKYWTKALNASEAQLRAAVRAVGSGATKVREFLKKR